MRKPKAETNEEMEVEIKRLPQMNGKPKFEIIVKSVLNFRSAFGYKLMCDYLTFSLGSACVAACAYCYVESMLRKLKAVQQLLLTLDRLGLKFEDVVIVRFDGLRILTEQLTVRKPAGLNLGIKRVVYTSPLVDPALNPELADQTLEACMIIMELTNWDVRILSKGNFLRRIAEKLPERFHQRVIFGHSTGILDDVGDAIEEGTASLVRRVGDHCWLQGNGFRTFAMLCPILPVEDADEYVARLVAMVGIERCEHAWAEVINLRGESMHRTIRALGKPEFAADADRVKSISGKNSEAWEAYARRTFEACAKYIPAEKLRFLQYATAQTMEYWAAQRARGAVLLGAGAERSGLAAAHPYWLQP